MNLKNSIELNHGDGEVRMTNNELKISDSSFFILISDFSV
jgi:hypothetical protein